MKENCVTSGRVTWVRLRTGDTHEIESWRKTGFERRERLLLTLLLFSFPYCARRRGEDVTISRHLLPSLALPLCFPSLPASSSSPSAPPREHRFWITNLIRCTAPLAAGFEAGHVPSSSICWSDLTDQLDSVNWIPMWFDGNFHSTSPFTGELMSQLDSRTIS